MTPWLRSGALGAAAATTTAPPPPARPELPGPRAGQKEARRDAIEKAQKLASIATDIFGGAAQDINREELDGGDLAPIVAEVVASLQNTEPMHVLCLATACQPGFTGHGAAVILVKALRHDMDVFVLGTLQGLVIARKPTLLASLAVPLARVVLEDGNRPLRLERRQILELLLLGSVSSPEVMLELGSAIEYASPEVAELLAGAHWGLAHACAAPRTLESPFGDAAAREAAMRSNSWVHNGAARPSLLPGRPGNDHFAFSYPYFSWPEGRWVLEPSPGQGDSPAFTLHAQNCAFGTSVEGCLLEQDADGPLLVKGTVARTSGRNYAAVYASVRDRANASQKNPYPLMINHWSARELRGWRARGADRLIMLGVPRLIQANLDVEAINDTGAERMLRTVALNAGQTLQLSKGELSGGDGWAVQTWIYRKNERPASEWIEIMRIGRLSLRMQESPAGLELAIVETKSQSVVVSAQGSLPDAKWLQIVCFGKTSDGVGFAVNGDHIMTNCRDFDLGSQALEAPELCSSHLLYGFFKVWNRAIDVATISREYQRGFSCVVTAEEVGSLLAFCPLQGVGPTALYDVSGHDRHLVVVTRSSSQASSGLATAEVSSRETDTSLPPTSPLYGLHSQGELFSIGPVLDTRGGRQAGVSLSSGASLWTQRRLPIADGAEAEFTMCIKPGTQACLVLHAGSYWDVLKYTYQRHGAFDRQVRLFLSVDTVSGHGFQYRISVQVAQPNIQTLVRLPCVGFTPSAEVGKSSDGIEIRVSIAYSNTHELSVLVNNNVLATLAADLPSLLRMSTLDGVFLGVMTNTQPLAVLRIQARANENAGAESRRLPWEISGKSSLLAAADAPGGTNESSTSGSGTGQAAGDYSPLIDLSNAASSAAASETPQQWQCPVCTCLNAPSATMCEACNSPNPNSGSTSTALVPIASPGPSSGSSGASSQWACLQCTFRNAASNSVCEMCQQPRPASAAPSDPGPSAASGVEEAWNCSICTLRNPASNVACSACSSPRPSVPASGPGTTSGAAGAEAGAGGSATTTAMATAAAASAPGQSAASTKIEDGRLRDAIKARCENLEAAFQAEMVRMAYSLSDEGSGDDSGLPMLDSIGNWDTTLGILDVVAAAGDEDRIVYELDGEYGDNQGRFQLLAHVDPTSVTWRIAGAWLARGVGRNGPHYVDLRLDDAGERLFGTWAFGDAASGNWNAKLEADAEQCRGLVQRLRETTIVTSLTEMALRDAREAQIKVTDDERNFPFSPFASGLRNMEQGLYNVCYQNSLLQALFATSALRRALLFPPEGTTMDNALIHALRELFARLLVSQTPVFASRGLQKALSQDWRTGEQMDVSDFHNYVFAQLEDAFPQGALLDELFGYSVAQIRRCASCGTAKVMDEAGRGLAVTLPSQFMPITDITAVTCATKSRLHEVRVPNGFELIRANVNADKDDHPCVFLCVRRDPDAEPVTELLVRVVPGTDPIPGTPNGYRSVGVNLNPGPEPPAPTPAEAAARAASGAPAPSPASNGNKPDQVYLFFQCGARGSPITDLNVLVGAENIASPPEDARVISTDLNPSWQARAVVTGVPVNAGATNASSGAGAGATVPVAQTADSGSTSGAGPATTPVKLCYMRGMPVTDVLVSTAPLLNQAAEYQVLDTSLNLALDPSQSASSDVFLWFSDSRVFVKPITDLVLVERAQEAQFRENGFESCGTFVFRGGRTLMKRRGEGTPITQVSIFRAPRVVPPYRFNEVLDLYERRLTTDHRGNERDGTSASSSSSSSLLSSSSSSSPSSSVATVTATTPEAGDLPSASDEIALAAQVKEAPGGARVKADPIRALFDRNWLPQISSNKARNGSGSSGSGSASSNQNMDPPPGLAIGRGKTLQLRGLNEPVQAGFFHGSFSRLGPEGQAGILHGTAFFRPESLRWSFLGYACQENNNVSFVEFSFQDRGGGNWGLSGFAINSANSSTSMAAAQINVDGKRVSSTAQGAQGPIVDLCVLRGGEAIPPGFEVISSFENAQRCNLRDGDSTMSILLAARHSADPGEDPIAKVALFLADLEELPNGFQPVTQTPSGANADLNHGTGGVAMYLAYRRCSSAQTTRAVHRLALQWRDLSEKVPPGFSAIDRTVSNQMEANLTMTGTHNIFLCADERDSSAVIHPHVLNGTYETSWGDLHLYAVSTMREATLVTGSFSAVSALRNTSPSEGLSLVLLPLEGDEGLEMGQSMLPSWTREAAKRRRPAGRKAPRANWIMCGSWTKTDAVGTDALRRAPTIWRGRTDTSHREVLASWSWAKTAGIVQLVQDTYVQLAIAKDPSELWRGGRKRFSDRRADHSIQSLVHHYFSSAVLDGSDMLMCDNEGVKRMHEQSTLMASPPEHLILTVKRMGFDYERGRAIKHLQSTRFDPVLVLPCGATADAAAEDIKDVPYGLYAVLVHTGANANSGHYFAYTRDASDESINERDSPTSPWRLLNDAKVLPVDWAMMTNQIEQSESNTVYLLFYRQLQPAGSEKASDVAGHHPAKKARTREQGDRDETREQHQANPRAMELERSSTSSSSSSSASGQHEQAPGLSPTHFQNVISVLRQQPLPELLMVVMHENIVSHQQELERRTSPYYEACLQAMME